MKSSKAVYGILAAVVLIIAVALGVKRYATAVAREKVTAALIPLSKYADINYDDVSVELIRRAAHVTGLAVKPLGTESVIRVADVALYDVGGWNKVVFQPGHGREKQLTSIVPLNCLGGVLGTCKPISFPLVPFPRPCCVMRHR